MPARMRLETRAMHGDLKDVKRMIRDRLDAEWPRLRIVDVVVRAEDDRDGDPVLTVDLVFKGASPNVDVAMDAVHRLHPAIWDAFDAFPVFSFIAEKEASSLRRGAR
jgi:hypothetical protein